MANLLIGSSNVNRFYKAADFPDVRKYKMVKCTQMEGFTAYMDSLDKNNDTVLISVLENFVRGWGGHGGTRGYNRQVHQGLPDHRPVSCAASPGDQVRFSHAS